MNITCAVCAGQLVIIRGRTPQEEMREVCPTCLADRMDQIRQLTDPHYGQAFEVRKGPNVEK